MSGVGIEMLKRFNQSNNGNVAIMTGLFIFILLILGGGAVDIIRVTTIRAEMQSATDSAVLAAAALSSTQDPVVAANNYFNANFDGTRYSIGEVEFQATVVADRRRLRVVDATAQVDVPTLFLKFIDVFNGGNRFETIEVAVESQGRERIQATEIAIVLDTSGSMNGPKINSLRTAASSFVEQLYEGVNPNRISVSVIPFSANVNIDPVIDDFLAPADIPAAGDTLESPCIIYDDSDYDDELIAGTRSLVVQPSDPGFADIGNVLDPNRCNPVPFFLNSRRPLELQGTISDFVAAGRTDAHIGMLWGVKTLSPSFSGMLGGDFPDRPFDYDDDVIKALVVMTDGDINPGLDADGVQRTSDASAEFLSLCNDSRDNGVLVFTIGFQIADGSQADIVLEECASNPSQYFLVEDLDLDSAFDAIAVAIGNLRVSE